MQKRKITDTANRLTRKQKNLFLERHGVKINILINESIFEKLSTASNEYYDGNNCVVLNGFWAEEKKVSPVYRYSIKKNEQKKFELYEFDEKTDKFSGSRFNDFPTNIESELKSIVIILESPHKDEYDVNDMPIAPAQGDTGDQIEDKICEILNLALFDGVLSNEEYRIILINPIPFQTSLFMLHKQSISGVYKTLRDKVWSALWSNCEIYKTEFVKLIQELNPIMLINCCTAGVKGNIALDEFPYSKFEIDHPSSWWKGIKNMTIKAV